MTYRPRNWEDMTPAQKRWWLKTKTEAPKRRQRKRLTEKDKEEVWRLMTIHRNQSLVAELLGVSRKTIQRFLNKYPIAETFTLQDDVEDYEEIQTWLRRQKQFAKENTIRIYRSWIRKFYEWMKKHHPDRARPRLWSSDHILEYIGGNETIGWEGINPKLEHNALASLRQLANKCPKMFPLIDLGLLPTKRAIKRKVSLAGREEYYFDIDPETGVNQVQDMIDNIPFDDEITKARNQGIIATLFNVAVRTGNPKTGLGLLGMKIEDLNLDSHNARIMDKHDIKWNVIGLSDETVAYLRKYLELRGNPRSGFLWVNGNGDPMYPTDVNKIIKQAGKNAGIKQFSKKTGEGKVLTAKTFRKTLVKYALEVLEMNPVSLIGTGKNIKTCFCVGWSDMDVLMKHYAPKLQKQIAKDRAKFSIADPKKPQKAKAEQMKTMLKQAGIDIPEDKAMALLGVMQTIAE